MRFEGEGGPHCLPYFIALDHDRKAVVVAIRGTLSLEDAMTGGGLEAGVHELGPGLLRGWSCEGSQSCETPALLAGVLGQYQSIQGESRRRRRLAMAESGA